MSQPFVGEIKLVGFNFAPRGYASCQGATLSIQQNAALFSLLGTTFGGNGTSTFQLPNFGGRVPVGQGQSPGTSAYQIGEVAGTENTTLLLANLPSHNHTAATTVSSGLTASTAINALTQPTAKQASPSGALLTAASDNATGALVNTYALPGNGTAATMASGAATTTLAGSITASTTVGLTGSNIPVGILQPYLGTNYIIATQGIFPSRN